MRKALILAAGLLAVAPAAAVADGLQFPDPAADADTIRLCAANAEVPAAERLKCGEPVFEACRFDATSTAPDEDWRVIFAHCIEREARAWDEILNGAYGSVRTGAKARGLAEALRAAQLKWIAWRDAKCIWKEPILAGNDAAFNEVTCRRDTTALRAIELLDDRAYFN